MLKIQINDFIVAIEQINDIEENSVGFVEDISGKKVKVFFIGKKRTLITTLVKDHDHLTGKAREWICDSCNTGLGRFKDDITILQRAIDYLKKYS